VSRPPETQASVPAMEDELAHVAKQIARLLLQPRYDEAELAELDVRARELRDRIRRAAPPRPEPVELRLALRYGGAPLVSGG
jgi:hypothetical protein